MSRIFDVEFQWEHASQIPLNYPWEITYTLSISADALFSNVVNISGIDNNCISLSLDSLETSEDYYWKVLAKNVVGDSLWSSQIDQFSLSAMHIENGNIEGIIPSMFDLMQNYPNPFNSTTKIRFALPKKEYVTLEIYNMLGQKLYTLLKQEMNAGYHQVQFDGSSLSSGIYFYSIQAGTFRDMKKLILLK